MGPQRKHRVVTMTDNCFHRDYVHTNTRNATVFQLLNSTEPLSACDEEMTVSSTVSVLGNSRPLSVKIHEPYARLSDLVPLARAVSDLMVQETIDHSGRLGKTVVCTKKCSTCCRYLVPVSIPEAICIYDEIQSLPPDASQEFWDDSLAAARQLLEEGSCSRPHDGATLKDVGQWYSDKEVTCPFLKNDLCAIYALRPLACREHLVTTPASHCRPETVESAEKPDLGCSVLEALGQVVADLEGGGVEAIMLPLILPWIQENGERIHREWPAREMAQGLLNALGASPA